MLFLFDLRDWERPMHMFPVPDLAAERSGEPPSNASALCKVSVCFLLYIPIFYCSTWFLAHKLRRLCKRREIERD